MMSDEKWILSFVEIDQKTVNFSLHEVDTKINSLLKFTNRWKKC